MIRDTTHGQGGETRRSRRSGVSHFYGGAGLDPGGMSRAAGGCWYCCCWWCPGRCKWHRWCRRPRARWH